MIPIQCNAAYCDVENNDDPGRRGGSCVRPQWATMPNIAGDLQRLLAFRRDVERGRSADRRRPADRAWPKDLDSDVAAGRRLAEAQRSIKRCLTPSRRYRHAALPNHIAGGITHTVAQLTVWQVGRAPGNGHGAADLCAARRCI